MAKPGVKRKTTLNSRSRTPTVKPIPAKPVVTPRGLSTAERAAFRRFVAECRAAGTLARVSVSLLVAAARTVALLDRAAKELHATKSLVSKTTNGMLQRHPAESVFARHHSRLNAQLVSLGLVAQSSRAAAPTREAESPNASQSNALRVLNLG